jgi:hypothetical protein
MTVEIETDNGKKVINNGVSVEQKKTKAEADAEKVNRKPAPNIEVPNRFFDYRSKKLKELNDRNDGYEYSYERQNVTDWDLEAKEAELVKDEKGRKLHFKGDPIIRRKKVRMDAERIADAKFSEETLKSMVKSRQTTVKRNRKNPNDTE